MQAAARSEQLPAWGGALWNLLADSACQECEECEDAYNAVPDGNKGDAKAMYAKYAELMGTGQFGCRWPTPELTAAPTPAPMPRLDQE